MRHGFIAFCCLIAFSPFAFAQALDKARFRQAIELPSIATSLGVHFRSQERDGLGKKFAPDDKIAELQKKLTGGFEDAEIYLEQAPSISNANTISRKPGTASRKRRRSCGRMCNPPIRGTAIFWRCTAPSWRRRRRAPGTTNGPPKSRIAQSFPQPIPHRLWRPSSTRGTIARSSPGGPPRCLPMIGACGPISPTFASCKSRRSCAAATTGACCAMPAPRKRSACSICGK